MSFTNIFEAAEDETAEDVRYFLEKKSVDVNARGIKGMPHASCAAFGQVPGSSAK